MNEADAIIHKFLIFSQGPAPSGFRRIALNTNWTLAIDDDLAIAPVLGKGKRIGWLLGVPVDLDDEAVVTNELHLTGNGRTQTAWDEVKQRCAGSWLFIGLDGDQIELRPDADATIGAVFDPAQRRIASHAFLLAQEDYWQRLDQEARKSNEVEQDGWFTGGLTAHRGIYRLLPNHRLNTRDFEHRRIAMQLPSYRAEVEPLIAEISEEVRKVVRALRAHGKTAVCLTGGNETRAILAILREDAPDIDFVTIGYARDSRDLYLASRLVQIAGLRHRSVPSRRAAKDEIDQWLIGAGHAMAGTNAQFFPTTRSLDKRFLIGGLGGEVGRGFLWPKELPEHGPLDAAYILKRLKQPTTAQNLQTVSAWVERLPDKLDPYQILDLAYLELRMGPWAFAQPRMSGTVPSIHPLISYNQFARMWSIEPVRRANNELIRQIIEQNWPELLKVPINRWGNHRDFTDPIIEAIRHPKKIRRKIRQIAGL